MLQNEFQNAVGKISETQQAVTSQFFTQSLETMNQVNPMLFSEEVIERWQNFFEKNTTCFNENVMFANNMLRLFNYTTMRSFGLVPDPVVLPEKGDRRFFDESWNEHAVFDHIKQFYLLISKYLMETAQCITHLDDKVQSQYDFYVKQWLDALSPANFAATNPQVLNETINQKGQNLIQGAKSLIEDFARGKGQKLMTRMTDYESFEVGENVATTPGKMIYQNDLIQLIQYEPTTKTVFETPLLICPPWINKFYILDLPRKTVLFNGQLIRVTPYL
jgi:polyhydroxyalkanoate synthase